MLFVVGPGHGAPAVLASLWLEGTLEKFYPKYSRNTEGLTRLISEFSTTGGFPRYIFLHQFECSSVIANLRKSHVNAEFPGTIHEGGELGYALSVAFGAVMDNPDLIVPCVVGDGEAETGPTATCVDRITLF